MKASGKKYRTVDEYLSALPESQKGILEKLRRAIKQTAPKAEEIISYNMPAFKLNGMLVYYAAYDKHIGLYPGSSAIGVFKKDLTAYETSKGTVRFPIEKALPVTLIKKIVKYKVLENLERAIAKKKRSQ